MSKWIENLSRKIGFTKTESQIVLFLLAAFSVGLIVSRFKDNSKNAEYLEFDYSIEDSLFNAAIGNIEIEDTIATQIEEKSVVSKSKLLDFGNSKKRSDETVKPKTISGKININTAGISELNTLPGIGIKTAENIFAYRKKVGKFTKAEDLLNIKGIGKAKLTKLRELIKFE
jgi:competence protein ComEA